MNRFHFPNEMRCPMNRKLRTALIAVLALAFLGSSAMLLYKALQYKEGDQDYAQAEELAGLPDLTELPGLSLPEPSGSTTASSATSASSEPDEVAPVYVDPYADALRNMDFSALREVSSDVLGWILVPNTRLSYPLVQGSDNSYYLNHTWRKSRNSVGAIFLECQNSRDLSDFNTIIYGHRMNNRSMFGTLHSYQDQSYWAKHPYLYITDDNGSHKYEIFAAYEVSVDGDTYRLSFSSDQSKQAFLDFCLTQSVIDTGVVPTVYDRIVTLSTCTGNGHDTRWVVQGVLKGEAPSDSTASQSPTSAPEGEPADPAVPQEQEPEASDSSQALEAQPDASGASVEEPRVSQDIPREPENASGQR